MDNPGGAHVQGSIDAGQPVSREFPVQAAGKDPNGNKAVFAVDANGNLLVTVANMNFSQLQDVQLTAPAQGDTLYYNGTKWVNLHAGTVGQVLTTEGPGANPQWTTLPTSFSGDVTLAPSTSSRNVIVPTGDAVVPLAVGAHSATQSADLQQWQDSTGVPRSDVTAAGVIRVPNRSLLIARSDAAADITNPFNFFATLNHVSDGSLQITDPGGVGKMLSASAIASTQNTPTQVSLNDRSYNGFTYQSAVGPLYVGAAFGAGAAPDFYIHTFDTQTAVAGGNGMLGVRNLGAALWDITSDGTMEFRRTSSTTKGRLTAVVDSVFAVSTDATRQGRLLLSAVDFNGAREGLRIEANGSAAALGFYGHGAAAQPTITGSRGGNAALASLLSALAGQGLIIDNTTA